MSSPTPQPTTVPKKRSMVLQTLMWLGIALVAGIALILIMASMKPDNFTIKRHITIQAPPEKVFALINDFHKWTAWSPWEKLDPNLKRSYSGQESGVGAVYEWEGNDSVGKGRMEIKESKSPTRVLIDLHFLSPFEANNVADFTLNPKDDSTEVVWEMRGSSPFMMKIMTLFMDMDSMIGKDFESGLAAMKANAES